MASVQGLKLTIWCGAGALAMVAPESVTIRPTPRVSHPRPRADHIAAPRHSPRRQEYGRPPPTFSIRPNSSSRSINSRPDAPARRWAARARAWSSLPPPRQIQPIERRARRTVGALRIGGIGAVEPRGAERPHAGLGSRC
jgi:hypothetical protein